MPNVVSLNNRQAYVIADLLTIANTEIVRGRLKFSLIEAFCDWNFGLENSNLNGLLHPLHDLVFNLFDFSLCINHRLAFFV